VAVTEENKLTPLEYFQALFGDRIGSEINSSSNRSLWLSAFFVILAAFVCLSIIPRYFGPLSPPTKLLEALPFYTEQFAKMGKSQLGFEFWWLQFVCVLWMIALAVFVAFKVIRALSVSPRVRTGFKGVPIINPPTVGLAIVAAPMFSIVVGSPVWDSMITGSYRASLGANYFFILFWANCFFLTILCIWHGVIFIGLIVIKFLKIVKLL
jgi:hypothetical protein